MPRGKYLRKNKRNETALITRLMQISLKMDDHFYNGKHITAPQAGEFLQEIATLKLQCLPTNIRALQVIEKLTRCMGSILTGEDSGHGGYSFNTSPINTQYAGSTSPVYSLLDEDRIIDFDEQNDVEVLDCRDDDKTAHKQINLAHTSHEQLIVTTSCNKQAAIIHLPLQTKNNSNNPKNNLHDDKIIDLTNDIDTDETENHLPVSNEQNSSVAHLNIAISNMSIQDGLGSETKFDGDNCSQSILDNNDIDKANKEADKEKDNVVVENEEPHKVEAKAHVTSTGNNYLNTHIPITDMPTEVAAIATTRSASSQLTNLNSELVNQSQHTLPEKKIKRKTKQTGKGKENYNALVKKKSKPKTSKVLPNCCQQNTMVAKEATTSINATSSKGVKKPKRNLKNKVHAIYNNNVENDLSWVENLRYVREISPEENDPALSLLQDNFWDNFTLPDTWNDSEFD